MTLQELTQKLKTEKAVAIVTHVRPDGDAVGSALALASALKKVGVSADVFCDDSIPQKFFYLAGACEISVDWKDGYTAMCAVDCADLGRMGGFSGVFGRFRSTYNVDHHVSNTRYAKNNYVEDVAANAMLVKRMIGYLGVEIDKNIANCLLTGISTDTGHFMHSNVTADALFMAAELATCGAEVSDIARKMYRTQSAARLALLSHVNSRIRYFCDGQIAVQTVTKADLDKYGAKIEDTEGFIDNALSVEGVEIAVCMTEHGKNAYKVSFRSKGKANVNAVAGTFGGGGHILASGCMISGYYEDVVDKIVFTAGNYLQ